MQIRDIGIIVSKRQSGEKSAVLTLFTKEHGLYTCFVKNISGKNSVIYQLGNIVDLFISARLDEHMGTCRCELLFGSSHFMHHKMKLYSLSSLLAMIVASFEERVPHPKFFTTLLDYIKNSSAAFKVMDYFRIERAMLSEAGYGLDFSSCAVTGSVEELKFVSPKSGRAVCFEAGQEYQDKLLKLPSCATDDSEPEGEEIKEMADLLLYFFKRYIFKRGEPKERREFVGLLGAN